MQILKGLNLSVQKMTALWLVCVLVSLSPAIIVSEASAEPQKSVEKVVYRGGYIRGYATYKQFILHENEQGFAELQTLFLGALSSSDSIQKCCEMPVKKRRIKLHVVDPYYVRLGSESVLIRSVALVLPTKKSEDAYLVLNDALQLFPGEDSESFIMLLRWAKGRGY
ncbi:hypothetical protein [Cellvibrio sp. QJXJ]|uniref:hypothetical protein n=1 Tax=Cellvibrio sp. QJXJ TaxID=2964606 RepID=UPI0021C2808A|nr:hypothetical protein [Cellvibrio sp. QJXJ]UUA75218.1 hypothetical protein NNX04_22430 [Cellvibrio sp. QJXJ]